MKIIDEAIKGYGDAKVQMDPATAGAVKSIENSDKKLKDAMKDVKDSEVTEQGAVVMKQEKQKEPKKVKSQNLKKMHLEEGLFEDVNMFGMSIGEAKDCLESLYFIEDTFADYNDDITLGQMIDILQGYVGEDRPEELESLSEGYFDEKVLATAKKEFNDAIKDGYQMLSRAKQEASSGKMMELHGEVEYAANSLRRALPKIAEIVNIVRDSYVEDKQKDEELMTTQQRLQQEKQKANGQKPEDDAVQNVAKQDAFIKAKKSNFQNKQDVAELEKQLGLNK